MVKWIGKFSLLLKLLEDAWMDMLPLSAMTQGQRERERESQHQADMTHLNDERRSRNEALLDTAQQAIGDTWYAAGDHSRKAISTQ